MDLDLTNPSMWVSIVLGALVLSGVSAFLQSQHEDAKAGEPLNPKGVIRDGLLGAIFTAMAWTLVPESMDSLTKTVQSTVSSAASSATTAVAKSGGGSGPDIDLQIGPARF
jgi:hypothetical protein